MGYVVTVHRAHGFRFIIFVNDHAPPHVHVFGAGGEAKIILEGPSGITLDSASGIKDGDLRRLMQEARRQREHLIRRWNKVHAR